MQTVSLLSDAELYNYGLIAEDISEVILSPDFVNGMILDNEATDSDKHTYYYVRLLRTLKPESLQGVLIDFPEDHLLLATELQKLGVQVFNNNYEEFELIELEIIPKWRLVKRRRQKKQLDEVFIKKRYIAPKTSKNKFKGYLKNKLGKRRDDFF
ncbi:hypothetical protein G7059_03720 [Erysipelothrix sp. HDW6A]|uniref:hypothetical protein n=1 Tax=Erysipelothrix sp. HDW6A TaxID=2714928 RepID=UPI00140CA840|nr:hypothetical protein [Erysipelothrix sp. HDW6A]QIK57020.1 hypothetical protein G7059_03720 [Erysipelothrix sp. HDW6A]